MNSRQRRTLAEVFEKPERSDIRWSAVESLLNGLGAEIGQRAGSRVAVSLNEVDAVFHRPHPGTEMDKGAVKSLRKFLTMAGVEP